MSNDDDSLEEGSLGESIRVHSKIQECSIHKALELDLNGYGLGYVPYSVCELKWLNYLHLSNNYIRQLPESIGELNRLQTLYLYGNKLKKLPDSIGRLIQLQKLYLYNNNLTELPESIGQLTLLRTLSLYNNLLTKLPDSIGRLTQLDNLLLAGNKLTQLPESIGNLNQLKGLDLSNHRLTKLPESIGNLAQLQSLDLSGNQLTELPESIGNLNQLESLNLVNNQLTKLPESLRNLSSLKMLYLRGNSELGLPEEVINPAWKANEILEYYFRVQGDRRPLNEAKLILVGRGGVGKTSIVNRLVDNDFHGDEKKTEGIKITEWPLSLNEKDDVRLNIWDFGGQEIMHATHQFFLTQRSLYLLVLNGREGGEDADAEYWLKLIESFGGESPIIVVLNKIKEHPFDVNRRALQQKYPAIREFIKTDCEDGTGLNQLRKVIEQETDRLEHLRDAFPASWFSIKNQLAGLKKNYLGFEEYREVCANLGEKDQTAQESLAFYLHSLGIALNYRDDPRLQDKHILNPHWVTNGIYKILNAEKLEKQKGDIRLNDLAGILDATEYPASMHLFLFNLMRKFDLCFNFPDDDEHYLIPELLDKQEPAEAADFDPKACLNFQYQYPVIPEGLLPRFIVRTHVLSEGQSRWRTGVILSFEDNLALVKADVHDKKVFISVSGSAKGRRRLLAVIRSDFERIHRDIRNLQPQEMIPLPDHPEVIIPYQELLVMEQNGMKEFPKVVGNRIINLSIHELLNGVDIVSTRRKDRTIDEQRQAMQLFYSYSHKDERLRNELETHLKLLQRQVLIDNWHDRKIEAGDEWNYKVDEKLERADIILLLVSANFMASDYSYATELRQALARQENGEAQVIPIIVRDVDLKDAPFAKLQYLPTDGKPITTWRNRDQAWRIVAEGIREVVEQMRNKSMRSP